MREGIDGVLGGERCGNDEEGFGEKCWGDLGGILGRE